MADVTWNRQESAPGSDVFEAVFDSTNKTTPVLSLNPNKRTTLMIKTAGSATTTVVGYLENPANSGAVGFTLATAAATATSVDYKMDLSYPLHGLDFAGTVGGGEAVTIQVIQSEVK